MLIDTNIEFTPHPGFYTVLPPGTYPVGNPIPICAIAGTADIGAGEPMKLVVRVVDEIVTAGGAGTVRFSLVSGPNHFRTRTVHLQSETLTSGGYGAGSMMLRTGADPLAAKLPTGDYQDSLGVFIEVAGAALVGGRVAAFLTVAD